MISDSIEQYLESLRNNREGLVKEMEEYANIHHVPIMEQTSLDVMLQILSFKQPKKILEIGTAIGYSALRMAKTVPDVHIVTVEKDEARYKKAVDFLEHAEERNRIEVLFGDALELAEDIKAKAPYQAVFIDAAKGQYQKFFDEYAPLVEKDGIVISDNILFRGMVAEEGVTEKRFKTMVKKLRSYNQYLMEHPDFQSTVYPIGDGVIISEKQ
ncbi:O-methyltransferase [Pseudalkalibacillus caeni]|uniref:tRNA 5-hydroxyuridine methyltransferase n=1 Tax=Exobacillus caeni TaxID=2574798 RepID=A0A5R9FAN9_9BACL|nr:O-methyltransferase [Pseudalkalibacillus caeni]TLS39300.1 O-methyltransferase [Pseudalkalibacillus caeni]